MHVVRGKVLLKACISNVGHNVENCCGLLQPTNLLNARSERKCVFVEYEKGRQVYPDIRK